MALADDSADDQHRRHNSDLYTRTGWVDATIALGEIDQARANGDRGVLWMRSKLQWQLRSLGRFLDAHAGKVLFVGLLVIATFCVGLKSATFHSDIEQLWAQPLEQEEIPPSEVLSTHQMVIQTAVHPDASVLHPSSLLDHLALIKRATQVTVTKYDVTWHLKDICQLPTAPQFDVHYIEQMFENMMPCTLVTPLDCFWEGSKLLGPDYAVHIPLGIGNMVKWTNLNPVELVSRIKAKEPNFDYHSLEEYFRRAGITTGYQYKPCLNPHDPDCPSTAPNNVNHSNRSEEGGSGGKSAVPPVIDVGAMLTRGCHGFAAKYMHWPADLIVGGASRTRNGSIVRARALQTVVQLMGERELYQFWSDSYRVHHIGWSREKAAMVLSEWQQRFAQEVEHLSKTNVTNAYRFHTFSTATLNRTLRDHSGPDLIRLGVVLVAAAIYSWTVYSTLGCLGVLLLGALTAAGLGVCSLIGLPMSLLSVHVVPYVSVGLAMRDMFLVLSSRRTNHSNNNSSSLSSGGNTSTPGYRTYRPRGHPLTAQPTARCNATANIAGHNTAPDIPTPTVPPNNNNNEAHMHTTDHYNSHGEDRQTPAEVLQCAGPTILSAAFTQATIFLAATVFPVQALRVFCLQCAVVTSVNTAGLLLVFPAVLALELRCRRAAVPCFRPENSRKHQDLHNTLEHGTTNLLTSEFVCNQKKTLFSLLLNYYLTMLIFKPFMRVILFVLYVSLIIFCVFHCLKLEYDVRLSTFLPSSTQEYQYLEYQHKYFGFYNFYLVTTELEYPLSQPLLYEYHNSLSTVSDVLKNSNGGLDNNDFWLSNFRDYLKDLQDEFDKNHQNNCLNNEKWHSNATEKAVLAFKLLAQTGIVEFPVDKSEIFKKKLVENDVIDNKAFYNYLSVWNSNDEISYTSSQANFHPKPFIYDSSKMEFDLKIPKSQPLVYAQMPFYLKNMTSTSRIVEALKQIHTISTSFNNRGLKNYPVGLIFSYFNQFLLLDRLLLVQLVITVLVVSLIGCVLIKWTKLWCPLLTTLMSLLLLCLVNVNALTGTMGAIHFIVIYRNAVLITSGYLSSMGSRERRLKLAVELYADPIIKGDIGLLIVNIVLITSKFEFIQCHLVEMLAIALAASIANSLVILPVMLSIVGPQAELQCYEHTDRISTPQPPVHQSPIVHNTNSCSGGGYGCTMINPTATTVQYSSATPPNTCCMALPSYHQAHHHPNHHHHHHHNNHLLMHHHNGGGNTACGCATCSGVCGGGATSTGGGCCAQDSSNISGGNPVSSSGTRSSGTSASSAKTSKRNASGSTKSGGGGNGGAATRTREPSLTTITEESCNQSIILEPQVTVEYSNSSPTESMTSSVGASTTYTTKVTATANIKVELVAPIYHRTINPVTTTNTPNTTTHMHVTTNHHRPNTNTTTNPTSGNRNGVTLPDTKPGYHIDKSPL